MPSSRLRSLPLLALLGAAIAAEPVELRGYGTVTAELTPTRSVFTCESVAKADLLLDKLQADLGWDASLTLTRSAVKLGAAEVATLSAPGYGSALIARSGTRVVVLGGADPQAVSALAAAEPLLHGANVTSTAAKPHPFYLDYYDLRAFKSFGHAMKGSADFGLETRWPFLKSFGGSFTFFGPFPRISNAVPGGYDFAAYDYEVREAERQGGMIVLGPCGGGEMPLWERNSAPELAMQPSATMALGDWGGAGMAGTGYESWAAPIAQRWRFGLGCMRQAIERYRDSANVGGWMPFAGSPGVEYNFHGRSMHSWDHSPAGEQGMRRWLQEVRKLSLADLGLRWHGDATHYASWNEVHVPDLNEFYGKLGDDSLRIRDGWHWRKAEAFSDAILPSQEAGWVPMAMPPAQQQAFISHTGINVFDTTFDAAAWSKRAAGKPAWLVFGEIGVGNHAARVWLNGKPLVLPTDADSITGPFAIALGDAVRPGANHLQVALNAAAFGTDGGTLAGPVFLTVHEPKRAPYMAREDNARHLDLIEWTGWAMTEYHRELLTVFRKLDPDRPFVLSGGGGEVCDLGVEMCTDFGMGRENTGREAHYDGESMAIGYAAGYYGTSEWSGTPGRDVGERGDMLERGFGWTLIDADGSHNLYYSIEAFQKEEQRDQWFTRHHRQLELFGKFLRQPDIVALRSVHSVRLGSSEPGGWNMGRGEFQAAHYDNACVTDLGLRSGQADAFPILFDGGSDFMEADTVAAIRRYVERGGTFIALHNTARHTALEPDRFLLSELTGFKPTIRGPGGTITFAKSLGIFTGWEGRTFPGCGSGIDWQNADYAKTGLSLTPVAADAVALATWDDGSVAIGCRRIGKGRIIILGSTFWRAGKDIQGIWRTTDGLESEFYNRLFADCGVQRRADASVPEVWARRMVTKNGLQHWLVSYNSENKPTTSDLWMATDGKPDAVTCLESNASVPFVSERGGISIKDVEFKPYEVRTYAIRRAPLAGALPIWWQEKTTYWKRTPTQLAAAAITLPPATAVADPDVLALGTWRFATDPQDALAKAGAWKQAGFDDHAWRTRETGPWNLLDDTLKDYHGAGLYRFTFTLPPAWHGSRIVLNGYNNDLPIVYDTGEFAINGKDVFTYKAHHWSQTYNHDVTALVHPGTNVVTLRALAGKDLGGLNGNVWLEAWHPLAPVIDLAGTWQAVQGDWIATKDLTVPGTATAKCLRKTVAIPANWKGRTAMLEWTSNGRWVGPVMINGRPINTNGYAHPYGLMNRLNVGLYLKPGEANVIEFWPYGTMEVAGPQDKNSVQNGLQLGEVRIGCNP